MSLNQSLIFDPFSPFIFLGDHMEAGFRKLNVERAIAKRRIILTDEDINFIRTCKIHDEELAKKYGCSISFIRSITKNINRTYYDPNYKPKETIRKNSIRKPHKPKPTWAKSSNESLTILNNLFFSKEKTNEYN